MPLSKRCNVTKTNRVRLSNKKVVEKPILQTPTMLKDEPTLVTRTQLTKSLLVTLEAGKCNIQVSPNNVKGTPCKKRKGNDSPEPSKAETKDGGTAKKRKTPKNVKKETIGPRKTHLKRENPDSTAKKPKKIIHRSLSTESISEKILRRKVITLKKRFDGLPIRSKQEITSPSTLDNPCSVKESTVLPNTLNNISPKKNSRTVPVLPKRRLYRPKKKRGPEPLNKMLANIELSSRRTSSNSGSDGIFWTKDMSSSSTITFTTVKSEDLIPFHNKFPVVWITDINKFSPNVNNASNELLFDSTSSSSSNSSLSELSSGLLGTTRLNLSTSSISPSSPIRTETRPVTVDNVDKTKCSNITTLMINTVDREIITWLPGENNEIETPDKKSFYKNYVLIWENSVFVFKDSLLNEVSGDSNAQKQSSIEQTREETIIDSSKNEVALTTPNLIPNEDIPNHSVDMSYHNEDHSDNAVRDDDDALSLFAESITCIETSRLNSSVTSLPVKPPEIEEYIPQPVTTVCSPKTRVSYCPTKIDQNSDKLCQITKVCEKQNADSTSIKETDQQIRSPSKNVYNPELQTRDTPYRTLDYFPTLVRCTIFKGICFNNLLSKCKKHRCRFSHKRLEVEEIRKAISILNNDSFLQEYISMRNYPPLRQNFGMCFVEECVKRKLTRVLVQMSIDFIHRPTEDLVTTAVIEHTLLYLNNESLSTCEDLLNYTFGSNALLCEIYMKAIANTQNFQRFTKVFIKLTNFIITLEKRINFTVATHILERLCILPFEEQLARSLIKILLHTYKEIINNRLLLRFEEQLKRNNSILYEEFLATKEIILKQFPKKPQESSRDNNVVILPHSLRKRYTSPDTTNFENLNKANEDPSGNTPIDSNRPQSSLNSTHSSSSEDSKHKNNRLFENVSGLKRTFESGPSDRHQDPVPPQTNQLLKKHQPSNEQQDLISPLMETPDRDVDNRLSINQRKDLISLQMRPPNKKVFDNRQSGYIQRSSPNERQYFPPPQIPPSVRARVENWQQTNGFLLPPKPKQKGWQNRTILSKLFNQSYHPIANTCSTHNNSPLRLPMELPRHVLKTFPNEEHIQSKPDYL